MADGDTFVVKRPPISMILKLVATVVILALVVYSLDLDKLSGALSAIDWHWLVLGSAASALFVSLRIIKWRELTRTNGMNASGKEIARTALLGLAVGLITPVRLGELVGVAPFPRPDRGRAILSHGYDRLYELFAVLVFSLPAAFLLLGWAGRLVSLGIVATYGVGIAMAQSAYWRSKFGGFSLLRKVPKLDALLSTIIATSPVYWMLSITYFLTGYLLLMCFIVGIEPIHDWHAVFILPVVTLSNLISITIGGLGVREGLAAALSPSVGLAPEVAAAAFFLSFFSTRLIPGLHRARVDRREHEAPFASASKRCGLDRRRRLLHRKLRLQAFEVAEDRRDREHAPVALEPQAAVLAGDIAVDREVVPLLGMADIVDRDVVVLAPEEGDGGKFLAITEHVQRRGLSLALGNHPMLDAYRLAAIGIGPPRDIAGGENRRLAGFEIGVHGDAAIDR